MINRVQSISLGSGIEGCDERAETMWECSSNGWGLQSDLALVFDVPRNTGYVGFFKKQILARADGLPKSDRKIASEPDLFEGELVMSWQSFIRYSRLIDICTHNAEAALAGDIRHFCW